jgi:hypothetical protein
MEWRQPGIVEGADGGGFGFTVRATCVTKGCGGRNDDKAEWQNRKSTSFLHHPAALWV